MRGHEFSSSFLVGEINLDETESPGMEASARITCQRACKAHGICMRKAGRPRHYGDIDTAANL